MMEAGGEANEASATVLVLTDEIKKLHADFVAEVHKRELSSFENFDKSVLTFSSSGLALSVGFLKDFVPIRDANLPWALYLSWTLFTLATCSTMISFLVSGLALADQKKLAYAFYIERNESAFSQRNYWNRITQILNYGSGGSFLIALILTTTFISVNLEKGSQMKQANSQQTAPLGALVPALQAVAQAPNTKGLPVPTMQPLPTSAATASQSAPNQTPPVVPAAPAPTR